MDIQLIVGQLQTITTLYAEVLACIIGAAVLGLLAGMMIRRSRYKKQLAKSSEQWRSRYLSLEESARADAENLEEQLQSLAEDSRALQTANRTLNESLKRNDTNAYRTRAESIELNQQHVESHEKLQQILKKKDQQIIELGNRLNLDATERSKMQAALDANVAGSITRLTPDVAESYLDSADVFANSTARLSDNDRESLLKPSSKSSARPKRDKRIHSIAEADDTLDNTADLSEYGLEQSTVAMDEDALAVAQKTFKSQHRD